MSNKKQYVKEGMLRGKKLINILDLAFKQKEKGNNIFNKDADDGIIYNLYQRIMIMTNSNGYSNLTYKKNGDIKTQIPKDEKEIINKLKLLCQKAYYMLESS